MSLLDLFLPKAEHHGPTAQTPLLDLFMPRAEHYGPIARPAPTDDYWYQPVGPSTAGQRVTGHSALTVSGCWAATNMIAGLFGQLPCKLFKRADDGREEAVKHPAHKIVGREANPDMDSFVFWEMMTQWWVNYGTAFAEKQYLANSGKLFALWPIHPTRVKPERDNDRNWTGKWLVRNNGGADTPIADADMFRIVGNLSDDGLTGKGVLMYAARAIGVALAHAKYEGDFYLKGGRPAGVLEHPAKLGDKARESLRREWREIHQEGNEIAVLWEGMKFNPLSVDPEHMKLIESRIFAVQELARFYDLPPHVLYDLSNGTIANVEEMGRFLVSQPFGRRIVRVEKALGRQLLSESEKQAGYYFKFNINALLRGDPKQRAEVNQTKFNSGVLSIDEWRAQDEQNKLPNGLGEQTMIRRDMAPLKLVIESAEQMATTPIPDTPEKPETPPTPPTRAPAKPKRKTKGK